MKNITVRRAFEHEVEPISDFLREYRLDDEGLHHHQFFVGVAKNNKILGFGRAKEYKRLCELSSVGVIKEFRNKGIGKKLIKQIIAEFPSDEIWLTTKIPDYFKKFDFTICHTPPDEILFKQRYYCSKLHSNIADSNCMVLKKKQSNTIVKCKNCPIKCTKK